MSTPSPDDVLADVRVNYDRFYENWSGEYKEKFRKVMQESDDETLGYIASIAGTEVGETSTLFEDILRNRSQAVLLFSIYRFISGKKLSVRSLAERRGDSLVDGMEYCYVLKQIANGDESFVYKVQLYNTWTSLSDIYAYEVADSLPADYKKRLKGDFKGLKLTLARRTGSSNFSQEERDWIEFEDGDLVNINRQTSDRAERDVSGRQRRRNVSSVFIEFDENSQRIRIGTSNTNVREVIRNKIQDILEVFLYDLETDVSRDEVDEEEFVEELTRDIDDPEEARVLAIEFERTNIPPASPLKISKRSYDRDIRSIIRSLDTEVVGVELDNVGKLWLQVGDIYGKINVQQSVNESFIRLSSDIDTQRESLQREFRSNFQELFGVPTDKKIPLHWVTGDRRSFIASMLKNPSLYDSRRFPDQDLTKKIDELGVISRREVTQHRCEDCNTRYPHQDGECPDCGGELHMLAQYRVPQISKPGIRRFLRDVIKSEGLTYLGKKTERIFRTEYEFLRVKNNTSEVDLLINSDDVSLTEKAVEHLQKSLNPVLVVNPGDVKNMHLLDEGLTGTLDLAELIDRKLDSDLPIDYISNEVERVARSSEEIAAKNARSAYDNVTNMVEDPEKGDSDRFEQEVFHLLNQIIPSTQQWGNKRSGKSVPDGFAELFFESDQGQFYRSFAYDSKFTGNEELDIDTDETKRLRDYVHRIIESEHVKSSRTKLSHFMIVTNAKPGRMNVIAGRLNRMRNWDGYPVYMHSSFPLALHVAYNENIDLIKNYQNIFLEELYRVFNGDRFYQTELEEEEYISLKGEDVESLMESFDESIDDNSLVIDELREFLEKDIFP